MKAILINHIFTAFPTERLLLVCTFIKGIKVADLSHISMKPSSAIVKDKRLPRQ